MADSTFWLDADGNILVDETGLPFFDDHCCCSDQSDSDPSIPDDSDSDWCCRTVGASCGGSLPLVRYYVPVAYADSSGSESVVYSPAWSGILSRAGGVAGVEAAYVLGDWVAFETDRPDYELPSLSVGDHVYVYIAQAGYYLPTSPESAGTWCSSATVVNGGSGEVSALLYAATVTESGELRLSETAVTAVLSTLSISSAAPTCGVFSSQANEFGVLRLGVSGAAVPDWLSYHVGYSAGVGCYGCGYHGRRALGPGGEWAIRVSPEFSYHSSLETYLYPDENDMQYAAAARGASLSHRLPDEAWVAASATVCSGLYNIAVVRRTRPCPGTPDANAYLPCGIELPGMPEACGRPGLAGTALKAFVCVDAPGGGTMPAPADTSCSGVHVAAGEYHVAGIPEQALDPEDIQYAGEGQGQQAEVVGTMQALPPGTDAHTLVSVVPLTYIFYASRYNRCPPVPYPVRAMDPLRFGRLGLCDGGYDESSSEPPCPGSRCGVNAACQDAAPAVPYRASVARLVPGAGKHKPGYINVCRTVDLSPVDESSSLSESTALYCVRWSDLSGATGCALQHGGLAIGYKANIYDGCEVDTCRNDSAGNPVMKRVRWRAGTSAVLCEDVPLQFDAEGRPAMCEDASSSGSYALCCRLDRSLDFCQVPKAYLYYYFDEVCGDDGPVSGAPTDADKRRQLLDGRSNDAPGETGALELPAGSEIKVTLDFTRTVSLEITGDASIPKVTDSSQGGSEGGGLSSLAYENAYEASGSSAQTIRMTCTAHGTFTIRLDSRDSLPAGDAAREYDMSDGSAVVLSTSVTGSWTQHAESAAAYRSWDPTTGDAAQTLDRSYTSDMDASPLPVADVALRVTKITLNRWRKGQGDGRYNLSDCVGEDSTYGVYAEIALEDAGGRGYSGCYLSNATPSRIRFAGFRRTSASEHAHGNIDRQVDESSSESVSFSGYVAIKYGSGAYGFPTDEPDYGVTGRIEPLAYYDTDGALSPALGISVCDMAEPSLCAGTDIQMRRSMSSEKATNGCLVCSYSADASGGGSVGGLALEPQVFTEGVRPYHGLETKMRNGRLLLEVNSSESEEYHETITSKVCVEITLGDESDAGAGVGNSIP